MSLGKIIAVIGSEIAKDMRAKGEGEEAVKRREEIKKQKNRDGMQICIGFIIAFIFICIVLAQV